MASLPFQESVSSLSYRVVYLDQVDQVSVVVSEPVDEVCFCSGFCFKAPPCFLDLDFQGVRFLIPLHDSVAVTFSVARLFFGIMLYLQIVYLIENSETYSQKVKKLSQI